MKVLEFTPKGETPLSVAENLLEGCERGMVQHVVAVVVADDGEIQIAYDAMNTTDVVGLFELGKQLYLDRLRQLV